MLPVLLFTALASASEFKPAGKAVVSGVSELTLYAGIDANDPFWYVEGTIQDKPVLLRLATEGNGLLLTEAAAGRIGLKPKGKEGKKHAAVPSLSLGAATISGIKAEIALPKEYPYGTDGVIGIAAFPGLAWAIDPSAGKVKVGPSGAGSVIDALGTGVPFTQRGERKQKIGKVKREIGAVALATPVSVSGVSLDASLATGQFATGVFTEVDGGAEWYQVAGTPNPTYPLPPVAGGVSGETEMEWREVAVGGMSAWSAVDRRGAGLAYSFLAPARVGQGVLGHSALGVDSGRKLYVTKAVSNTAAVPYAGVLAARLRADLAAPLPAPAPGPIDADAGKSALAGKLSPLVELLNTTAQYTEAVEVGKRWVDADPHHCTSWLALGRSQMGSGDHAAAAGSFQKAADLYQPWAVRPLADRTALVASEGKRSKAPDFDGVWAQPGGCYVAWGKLANAMIAAGQPDAVAGLYPKYADLDEELPLAAGNALLLKGNAAGAEAAFRQAVQLGSLQNGRARGGMLLATRGRSLDLALAQVEATPEPVRSELRFVHVVADTLRTEGGPVGAVAGLTALASASPGSAAYWLVLAAEQSVAGTANSDSLERARVALAGALAITPNVASLHALEAERLRLTGKLAEAAAEAEKATALDPTEGVGWWVRSRIAETAGDSVRAAELRKRAGQSTSRDPVYASLLATTPG